MRLAFNTWKFKPLHDCTLRQYIHLLNSQYDPDSIRILVGQGQGSAQENIFREIYRAMEAVNGQLEQRYQHGLMQAEIAKSQAGRYLLFPQEELELIQEDLSARRGGVQIPRHLEILRSFWQQCHDATVKREVKKRKTPRKNSENMTIKSLREAMYEVVNERQVSSHSLTPSKLSYRQIPSPARFVAIPSPQAKTRMMQSAMNRSISESKGADFALSPHPDRLNALATPSTSINAFSATKLGGGLHLADIM